MWEIEEHYDQGSSKRYGLMITREEKRFLYGWIKLYITFFCQILSRFCLYPIIRNQNWLNSMVTIRNYVFLSYLLFCRIFIRPDNIILHKILSFPINKGQVWHNLMRFHSVQFYRGAIEIESDEIEWSLIESDSMIWSTHTQNISGWEARL